MWRRYSEIRAKNNELVIIVNVSPHFIKTFKEDLKIDIPIYTDPSRKSYEAAGLKRSVIGSIGPQALMNLLKNFVKGTKGAELQGDPWQLGGTLVINPQGRILFHFVSRVNGERAQIDDILRVL